MTRAPYDALFTGQSIDHGLAGTSEHEPVARPDARLPQTSSFIGISPIMQQLYGQIANAARSQAPVFIMGETGTGKEVCAEAIHKHSPRHDKPFIAINCAAIPRDLLESELFGHVKGAFTGAINDRDGAAALANGGTLFLDEVAEMAPDMQTKLLRFLQNFTFRKVGGNTLENTDVRIICATNRDPLREIAAGHLREDLFFRLHVVPLLMPPLRQRGDDVIDIAYALLRRYAREENKRFRDINPEARQFLRDYHWPGNVRQLQNIIRYICVMHDGETMALAMIPQLMLCAPAADHQVLSDGRVTDMSSKLENMTLAEIERFVIEDTVLRMAGNVSLAAAHLGVAPSTLYRKRLNWGPGHFPGTPGNLA